MAAPTSSVTSTRGSDPSTPLAEPTPVTLLELIETVGQITDDDDEIVATVIHMLHSGTVSLCGSFRGEPVTGFASS